MKIIIIGGLVFFSASTTLCAQTIKSIENRQTEIVINDSIPIKKGNLIQVNLPAGKNFVFIKLKKTGFNTKLLGKMADVVGIGATAVGMSSGSIKVLQGSTKVLRSANAIEYGANAITKIQELPISDQAKKIAGKKMEVIDWEFTNDGWIVTAKCENKQYEIYLQEAALAGEITL